MIKAALQYIKEELSNFLIKDLNDSGVEVELGNIALFETEGSTAIDEKLVVSLVNIEEESTLKNTKNIQHTLNGGIDYTRPPVFLNLYLLFSCNYTNYETALNRLGNVILFFQQRRRFDLKSMTTSTNENLIGDRTLGFRLTFELYTLTFEQINHMWGALGGRQIPSAMYKARLIEIDQKTAKRTGPPIQEVHSSAGSIADC